MFSPITTELVSKIYGDKAQSAGPKFAADFMASILGAALSSPANQLFNYFAITPEAGKDGPLSLLKDSGAFLRN